MAVVNKKQLNDNLCLLICCSQEKRHLDKLRQQLDRIPSIWDAIRFWVTSRQKLLRYENMEISSYIYLTWKVSMSFFRYFFGCYKRSKNSFYVLIIHLYVLIHPLVFTHSIRSPWLLLWPRLRLSQSNSTPLRREQIIRCSSLDGRPDLTYVCNRAPTTRDTYKQITKCLISGNTHLTYIMVDWFLSDDGEGVTTLLGAIVLEAQPLLMYVKKKI